MVAGKVKAAIGLAPKPDTPKDDRHTRRGSPAHTVKPAASPARDSPAPGKHGFPRSFGVYFHRTAQVQPRPTPADVAELLRVVEDLRERESQLRTQLLQQKLLRESAAIVPVLEREISAKSAELQSCAARVNGLEAENELLKRQVDILRERVDSEAARAGEAVRKMKEMEDEVAELKNQRRNGSEELLGSSIALSASQRFQGLMEASAKSNLLKNLRRNAKSFDASSPISLPSPTQQEQQQQQQNHTSDVKSVDTASSSKGTSHIPPSPAITAEALELAVATAKPRAPRVPKPPPKRCASAPSSSTSTPEAVATTKPRTCLLTAPPPPPPPPPCPPPPPPLPSAASAPPPPPPPPQPPRLQVPGKIVTPPPPPPPPPRRALGPIGGAAKVRRVPEVVEFYHSLMRRDSRRESGAGVAEAPSAASTRSMIGEIENRSAYLLAIKSDVETQGDFIRFLIKEVKDAAFTDIEDVVAFVKWLDDELSFLVDERAVLKHFDWPEQKADAMREAAFGYCDLKKLESEVSSFTDDLRQACGPTLKKMKGLLEKLEHGVYNLSRMRETATKRYKDFLIPSEWMLETGFVNQIKLASVKLAMKFMKRVSAELEAVGGAPEEEYLVVQGVRFAFRVHQFAGGFDVETMRAFEELRNKARSCQMKCQSNQQQQELYCRSTTC